MTREDGSKFEGTCKWWDAVKGCGFLLASDGGSDLFASQAEIDVGGDGFRALVPGQPVECIYTEQKDAKPIAKKITAPGGGPLPSFKDKFCAKKAIMEAKPRDPNMSSGTIKFFDATKNFGFIITEEETELFFHFSECSGVAPEAGDSVEYKTKEDQKGKTVACNLKNRSRKKSVQQQRYVAPPVVQPAYVQYQQPYPQQGGFTTTKKGTCKFFNEGKGFGFLTPELGGPDIHVHKSGVMGGLLEKGDYVSYEEEVHNGKVKATMVRKVAQGQVAGNKRSRFDVTPDYEQQPKQQRVQYQQSTPTYYTTTNQQQYY